MRPAVATARPVSRSRWIVAAAVSVLVIAAGAGWFLFSHQATAPQAAAAAPAAAVGVRVGQPEGRQPVLRVRRPHQGRRQGRAARPGRGLPREGAVPRGPGRQGRRPALPDREGPVSGAGRPGQGQPRRRPRPKRPTPSSSTTAALDLAKRQFSPQSHGRPEQGGARHRRSARSCRCKAALTQAEVNLDYTDIRSPIDGRIGRTAYTIGNLVNPASGVLATIVSQDPIYVLFPVSVRDLETIREARRNGRRRPRQDRHPHPPVERPGLSRSPASGTSPIRRSTSRPTR